MSEMRVEALVDLLRLLGTAKIAVWLDGGWGVDALLGRQTRAHKDVDIIVRVADVPNLQAALAGRGFAFKQGQLPNAFVLADGAGLEIDVHAVVFDADGNGVYRMQNGQDWIYPAEGFAGRGAVAGMNVRCLTPAAQVLCHAHGYVPTDTDRRDMDHLARRFGVILPPHLQMRSRSESETGR